MTTLETTGSFVFATPSVSPRTTTSTPMTTTTGTSLPSESPQQQQQQRRQQQQETKNIQPPVSNCCTELKLPVETPKPPQPEEQQQQQQQQQQSSRSEPHNAESITDVAASLFLAFGDNLNALAASLDEHVEKAQPHVNYMVKSVEENVESAKPHVVSLAKTVGDKMEHLLFAEEEPKKEKKEQPPNDNDNDNDNNNNNNNKNNDKAAKSPKNKGTDKNNSENDDDDDECEPPIEIEFMEDQATSASSVLQQEEHIKRVKNKESKVVSKPHIPEGVAAAVLTKSKPLPEGTMFCRGHDFDATKDLSSALLDSMMQSMCTTGFQATSLGQAIGKIEQMRMWRLSDTPFHEKGDEPEEVRWDSIRRKIRARIFLGYTANQVSAGQRDVLKFLVKHKMVDVLVTTAGGIEEDLMKCMNPSFVGDFQLDGQKLRKKKINRIGNLLVPNKNYTDFEDWMDTVLDKLHDEQDHKWDEWAIRTAAAQAVGKKAEDLEKKFMWTPSKMIERLGQEIDCEESILYWAAKNEIPVFCPSFTDGSMGDQLYFHSYKRAGLVVDVAADVRRLNDLAVHSHGTGMIVLGGGVVKHHVCNANKMRNGADFSVFINTSNDFDGSDSGGSVSQEKSRGTVKSASSPVKVCADATIVFPLIVSQTFAKNVNGWKKSTQDTVCWVGDLHKKKEEPSPPPADDEDY